MHNLVIKDRRVVYLNPQSFTPQGTWFNGRFDPTTTTDNAELVQVDTLPEHFLPGKYVWDGTTLTPTPEYEAEILPGLKDEKIVQINAGFDAALAASITMPSRQSPPTAVEIALAIEDFKADDPEGWQTLRTVHQERRTLLLAAVDEATTIAEIEKIAVSYAV